MQVESIEDLEITLLLEAIYQRYGHDFRNYARASITRRIRNMLIQYHINSISDLIPRIVHDESFFATILSDFSITFSEMFRDPFLYVSLRAKVVPLLRTYPFIRIWHAGCSTGEEVYSLAILLKEEGLLERCTIFATDFNDSALSRAREGVYSLENAKQYTANYQSSAGRASFSEYYHADHESMIIDQTLKKNITFANHNLATDSVFSEVQLIFCRNVLIYFDKALQDRTLKLFTESLVHGGFLCLGSKESMQFTSEYHTYKAIDSKSRIYQKIWPASEAI
jgi:chemotaxis protein methyltransferase CheR